MLKNVKLRAQKVGLDRDDFELEVQPIPVRVERSRKERIVELATVAMTTVIATVLGNVVFALL